MAMTAELRTKSQECLAKLSTLHENMENRTLTAKNALAEQMLCFTDMMELGLLDLQKFHAVDRALGKAYLKAFAGAYPNPELADIWWKANVSIVEIWCGKVEKFMMVGM